VNLGQNIAKNTNSVIILHKFVINSSTIALQISAKDPAFIVAMRCNFDGVEEAKVCCL
jgi:hypothetical protein